MSPDTIEVIFNLNDTRYHDISRSPQGEAAAAAICFDPAHKEVCTRYRLFGRYTAPGLPGGAYSSCLLVTHLPSWGLVQVFDLPGGCSSDGPLVTAVKVVDIFALLKCRHDNSRGCKEAMAKRGWHALFLRSVPTHSGRFSNGISKAALKLLAKIGSGVGYETRTISGLHISAVPRSYTTRYLDLTYPGWTKQAYICPHVMFATFGKCNASARFPIDSVHVAMQSVPACVRSINGSGHIATPADSFSSSYRGPGLS